MKMLITHESRRVFPEGGKTLRYRLIVVVVLISVTNWRAGPSTIFGEESVSKTLKFRVVVMGESVDREAAKAGFRTAGSSETHLSFTLFDASDGEKLQIQTAQFLSDEEAKRYFDWTVARAYKVFHQGTKTDAKGRSVGHRAEVMVDPHQKDLAVMWTDGASFRQILAYSLADAEELEKRYLH